MAHPTALFLYHPRATFPRFSANPLCNQTNVQYFDRRGSDRAHTAFHDNMKHTAMTPPPFDTSSLKAMKRTAQLMLVYVRTLLFIERTVGLPNWIDAVIDAMDKNLCRVEDFQFRYAPPSAALDDLKAQRAAWDEMMRETESEQLVGRAERSDARQPQAPNIEPPHTNAADFGLRPLSALQDGHETDSNHLPTHPTVVTAEARPRASGRPSRNEAARAEPKLKYARATRTHTLRNDQIPKSKITPRARPPPERVACDFTFSPSPPDAAYPCGRLCWSGRPCGKRTLVDPAKIRRAAPCARTIGYHLQPISKQGPGPSGRRGGVCDVGHPVPSARPRRVDLIWGIFMQEFLSAVFAGQPAWLWLAFLSLIGFLLWVDLGLLNRKDAVVSPKKSAIMWAGFSSLAIAFGAYIYFGYTPDPQFYNTPDNLNQQAVLQYFTGYLLETALAFDNIFVISMVFTYFAVPPQYQHRVLFWGIIGAIVFRGIFILAGSALVNEFTWVLYIFAAFLIFTGIKMITSGDNHVSLEDNKLLNFLKRRIRLTDEITNHNFVVRRPHPVTGKLVLFGTPLLLALIMVEAVDIVFAIDSVPAIFSVTRDPFIVYTSNIFAILGLRSMYFMLAAAVDRFKYLKYGLSLVLVLIGAKIFWNFLLNKELKLVPYLEPQWSLLMTVALLGGAILFSMVRTRNEAQIGKT